MKSNKMVNGLILETKGLRLLLFVCCFMAVFACMNSFAYTYKIPYNSTPYVFNPTFGTPQTLNLGGEIYLGKTVEHTKPGSSTYRVYGNIKLDVWLKYGTVTVYGRFLGSGTSFKEIAQVTYFDNILNTTPIRNDAGYIHHNDWTTEGTTPVYTADGGRSYQIKVVYSGPGGTDTTYFTIHVEDTIQGMLAGGVIQEDELHNCYRKNDDGEIVTIPKEWQIRDWYLYKSWCEYFGFPVREDKGGYWPDRLNKIYIPGQLSSISYTRYIFRGYNPDGTKKTKMTKPIIIFEGIDLSNSISWHTYHYKVLHRFGLWRKCLEQGYDIIFINYTDSLLSLLENAQCIIDAIKEINILKYNNNSTHKNIVMGASMGGLITRYALKYMETPEFQDTLQDEGITSFTDHDTSLFLSYDAPQQGANVPVSLQLNIQHLYLDPELRVKVIDEYEQLSSPAAKMMVTNHMSAVMSNDKNTQIPSFPAGERDYFLNELESLRTVEDGAAVYPQHLKKISLANGSGNGIKQNYNGTTMGKHSLLYVADLTILKYAGYSLGADSSGRDWQLEENLRPFPYNYSDYDFSDLIPYDNCPGSYDTFIKAFTDQINDIDGFEGYFCNATYYFPYVTFMPTTSALDLRYTNGNQFNVYKNLSATAHILNYTPFFDLHWESQNNPHFSISEYGANYILKYILERNLIEDNHYIGDGDVNEQTTNDSQLVEDYLNELPGSDLSPYQLLSADVNNDGYISMHDVMLIDRGIVLNKYPEKAEKYKVGDLNFDSLVNGDDYDLLETMLANNNGSISSPSTREQILADITGDGQVDNDDVSAFASFTMILFFTNARKIWFIDPPDQGTSISDLLGG